MHFETIKPQLIEILQSAEGRFMTAYQICQRFQMAYPQLWQNLIAEYPSANSEIPMGRGTERQYSPASFVANALSHFTRNDRSLGIRQELFECEGVSFGGIDPGFTGNFAGIWAIPPR